MGYFTGSKLNLFTSGGSGGQGKPRGPAAPVEPRRHEGKNPPKLQTQSKGYRFNR